MKVVLKIILTIFFILISLIFVISATFKFQLLRSDFWEITFETSSTYTALSQSVINNLENQAISEGGKKNDADVFTNLATPGNLKDLINKNVENLFGFMDGKSKEMIVYVPISRIPKSLLPMSLSETSDQIKLQDLLTETGVASISASQIREMQVLPKVIDIVFFTSILILLAILASYFGLTNAGKRLGFAGSALILSGIIIFAGSKLFEVLNKILAQDLIKRTDLAGAIMGIVVPPVIIAISKIWTIEGILLIMIGIILFFVKKPYNKS
jgi:hypothetical protein